MHARRSLVSSRRLRIAVVTAALSSSLLVSLASFASVPIGWSLDATLDGGTSSLGASIATTDTAAFVGAPFDTAKAGGAYTGAVYVYNQVAGRWASHKLTAPTPLDGGDFGTSVAASGDLLVVGAAGTHPAAYVFANNGTDYVAAQTWSDPATDKNGSFGGTVAVLAGDDGSNYVAVGAPPSGTAGGVLYVSRQVDGGAWSNPPTAITNPSSHSFAFSVAFASNGDLLVGDPNTGDGQVLIYTTDGKGTWTRSGTLPVSLDGGALQQFGYSVSTWSNLAVVTAPYSANDAGTYNGAAFVFASTDGGVWTQQAVLTGAADESFANFAPSIHAGLIAVGSASGADTARVGLVDVWAQSGSDWVSVPAKTLAGDFYFGQAVGTLGGTLFVGDTSALGAGAISDVTSSLFIETALYADAGATPDASQTQADASLPVDGAAPLLDGATSPPGVDAATPEDDGGTSAGTSSSNSGCSCLSSGHGSGNGWRALALQSALACLAWTRRRAKRALRASPPTPPMR